MNNERTDKIEQILNSLDGNQRAVAPDFFYTRLKARLESEENYIRRPWILRPVYALATLIIVLIINVAVILKGEQTIENNPDNDTVQSIAAEYSLNDNNSIYDLTLADK